MVPSSLTLTVFCAADRLVGDLGPVRNVCSHEIVLSQVSISARSRTCSTETATSRSRDLARCARTSSRGRPSGPFLKACHSHACGR